MLKHRAALLCCITWIDRDVISLLFNSVIHAEDANNCIFICGDVQSVAVQNK